MRRLASLVVALAVMASHPSSSSAFWLTWTNPSLNATVIDSTVFDCGGGDSLRDLKSVIVYVQGVSGGQASILTTLFRGGQEGTRDSLWVPDTLSGHFYMLTSDSSSNLSCPSNRVYHGPTSSVPLQPPSAREESDPIVRCIEVDIRGRIVPFSTRKASGIYLQVAIRRSGAKEVIGKKVILR